MSSDSAISQKELWEKYTNFCLKFHNALAKNNKSNIVCCPAEIALALGTLQGAKGKTAKEISEALEISELSNEQALNFFLTLKNQLEIARSGLSGGIELQQHRFLHAPTGSYFSSEFIMGAFYYSSAFGTDNFLDAQHIQNRIMRTLRCFDEEEKTPVNYNIALNTKMCVASTSRFSGLWPYKPALVQGDVLMMNHLIESYIESEKFYMFSLEYAGAATLMIFLPKPGYTLENIELQAATQLEQLMQRTAMFKAIEVSIPIASVKDTCEITSALERIGISSKTDLPDIKNHNWQDLSLVRFFCHNAFNFGYAGKEAEQDKKAASLQTTIDRPFRFMVIDNNTQLILMQGQVVQP